MINPFSWLRRQAAESVVLGISDGLRAVAPEGQEPPASIDDLRQLLAESAQPKALPAAKDDEPSPQPEPRRKAK